MTTLLLRIKQNRGAYREMVPASPYSTRDNVRFSKCYDLNLLPWIVPAWLLDPHRHKHRCRHPLQSCKVPQYTGALLGREDSPNIEISTRRLIRLGK